MILRGFLIFVCGAALAGPAAAADIPAQLEPIAHAVTGAWAVEASYDAGGSGRGEAVWRAADGASVLTELQRVKGPGGDGGVMSTLWWDAQAGALRGLRCGDDDDRGCSAFDAVWKDGELTWSGQYVHAGRTVAWRRVFSFPADRMMLETAYAGEPGREPARTATIRARKLGHRE
jgi:hypothetical protein